MTTRADMINRLSSSSATPTKTFVLEVHSDEPADYLRELVGRGNMEETTDAYLYRAYGGDGISFWVDQLDERFWSFHTQDPIRNVLPFLRGKVEERRDLDWMWLPSEHLRNIWPGATARRVRSEFHASEIVEDSSYSSDLSVQLSGRNAERLLDYISANPLYRSSVSFDSIQARLFDPEFGYIDEALNRRGRFAVSGDSIEFHLQFVRSIVNRYRLFVESCERRAISWTSFDEKDDKGATMSGAPIAIKFSKDIGDLTKFLDVVFSSRAPYRLWGIPNIVDAVAHVEAVDLHVGRRVRIDIGANWMRIYLEQGGCGNTIARLVSNMQSHFDSALTLVDPDLQAALTANTEFFDHVKS